MGVALWLFSLTDSTDRNFRAVVMAIMIISLFVCFIRAKQCEITATQSNNYCNNIMII